MKKIVVIYWSGTGNTEQMAEAVAQGAGTREVAVELLPVSRASQAEVAKADGVALGCPAMGNEVLEEGEMEPFVASLAGTDLAATPLVLFGSYDWGDGQWMSEWEERMRGQGARVLEAGLIVRNTPDEAGLAKCRELGERLAAAVG